MPIYEETFISGMAKTLIMPVVDAALVLVLVLVNLSSLTGPSTTFSSLLNDWGRTCS